MTTSTVLRVLVLAGAALTLGLIGCGGSTSQNHRPPKDPEELAIGQLKGEPMCRTDAAMYRMDSEPVFRAVDENGIPTAETRVAKEKHEVELVAKAYGWSVEHVAFFHPRYVPSWQPTGEKIEHLWICAHPTWVDDYEVRAVGMYCPSVATGVLSPSKKTAGAGFVCENEIINEMVKGCVNKDDAFEAEKFDQTASAARKGLSPSITKTSSELIEMGGVTCAKVGCYVKKANRAAFDAAMATVKKECPN